ncbi:hypothetical protein DCS_00146 [Drechmeria coniospora]|uniref:Uncharacterized protein n=1 Tax=Drechmeria coniospora TaxID=98403 RepID=A0A151GPI4_DRECN|nr:hypothetical protein DCS_00146 [Drechmeria coniospora]KYK59019.1 hypothetical protein DCS_00146 [Drechmeria coniospora]
MTRIMKQLKVDEDGCREWAVLQPVEHYVVPKGGFDALESDYDVSQYPNTTDFKGTCRGTLWEEDMFHY